MQDARAGGPLGPYRLNLVQNDVAVRHEFAFGQEVPEFGVKIEDAVGQRQIGIHETLADSVEPRDTSLKNRAAVLTTHCDAIHCVRLRREPDIAPLQRENDGAAEGPTEL